MDLAIIAKPLAWKQTGNWHMVVSDLSYGPDGSDNKSQILALSDRIVTIAR